MKDVLRMNEWNNAESCKAGLSEPGTFPEILLVETDLNGERASYVMNNDIDGRKVMWNQGAIEAHRGERVPGSMLSHNRNARAAGEDSEETMDGLIPVYYRAG